MAVTSERHRRRRCCDGDGISHVSGAVSSIANAFVVVGVVLLTASLTTVAVEVPLSKDFEESMMTGTADDIVSDGTTQVKSAELTTTTDYVSDVTSNETFPDDTTTVSYASNFDDATEEPAMTAETDVENGAGWDDGTASNGASRGEEDLAENQEMMRTFYERYNGTTSEVDLVFVLDRSGSVPRKGWQAIVQFVKNVLEHFTVDRHNTRVAVVTYSTTASTDINDLEPGPTTDVETKCTLYNRLDRIVARRTPYGYTATHEALQRASQVLLESRPTAKKAVIVVTDGKSNIGPPPVRVAVDLLRLRWWTPETPEWDEQLYGPQVEIYAFGVAEANLAELKSIASNLPGHLFTMTTFTLFELFAKSLHGDKQETNWILADFDDCANACNGVHAHCMCGTKIGAYACICDPGYQLIDSQCVPCPKGFFKTSLTPDLCSACPENTTTNHEASTSRDQCKPLPGHVRCPPLPAIDHGRSFYVEGDVEDEVADTGIPCEGVTDGNSCHYVCDSGYRLTGPPALTCNYSGTWDGEIPQCQIVDCHAIDYNYQMLVGATVQYLNGSTTYGSSVMAFCRRGTLAVGRTVWECDSNGLWTCPADFRCHEVFCDGLPLHGQLDVSPDVCRDTKVPVDTACQLRCTGNGFQLIGADTYTCTFDVMTMTWKPETWPTCKDEQPPKIVCPKDVEVTVAEWGDNSTIVHYDSQKPQATDNSGLVYYRVLGVPNLPNHAFPVGFSILTYEAYDDAGNKASCNQIVHVRARTVEVHNCPENMTVTVTSLRRTSRVEWSPPVFVGAGGSHLQHVCSVKSGSEFVAGTHHVICYARDYPGVTCQFHVNVVDPPCAIPYENEPPLHGALICGVMGHHYPRACRVHCREGYELRRHDAQHKFVCRWDGTWTIDGPWPNCYQSRRPAKALTENQLYVRYQGLCVDVRAAIAESFVSTMTRILDDEHGPCPPGFLCNVEEVRVLCGATSGSIRMSAVAASSSLSPRRRRHAEYVDDNDDDDDGEGNTAVVVLVTSAQLDKSNGSMISAEDQNGVMAALDGLSAAVWRQITDHGINGSKDLEVGREEEMTASGGEQQPDDLTDSPLRNGQVHVTEMKEVGRQWESIECREGEVPENDGVSTVCYACPPGSYRSAVRCEPCPIGAYQDRDGSTECHQCPHGTTTSRSGSRSAEDCRSPCKPGHHSSTGLEKCDKCPVGTFQDLPGSTKCTACPDNLPHTASFSGATSVGDCFGYVDCEVYHVACDVSAGFRCIMHAQVYDAAARLAASVNVSEVQCVCEADDGCPPPTTTKIDDVTTETPENSPVKNDIDDAGQEPDAWMLPNFSEDGDKNMGHSDDDDDDDFDLVFRRPSNSMYWILASSINEFSACSWLRPTPNVIPSMESSSVVLSIYNHKFTSRTSSDGERGVQVEIRFTQDSESPDITVAAENQPRVQVVVRRGVWNHLCVSWTRLTGYWRLHVNGTSTTSVAEVYSPLVGDYLRRGSVVVLGGQFVGEMTQFGFYDRIVTDSEANDMASTRHAWQYSSRCRPTNVVSGNMLSWRRVMSLVTSSDRTAGYVMARKKSRCLIPWEDDSSSSHADECDPTQGRASQCLNGGVCRPVLSTAKFVCSCPPGFTGSRCETVAASESRRGGDPCSPNPCLHGGVCSTDRDGKTAVCRCMEHWTGKHCQVSRAPVSCAMNPCVNNGTCVDITDAADGDRPSYRCICPELEPSADSGSSPVLPLVVGANCERLTACDTMPCGPHGTCVTTADSPRNRDSKAGGNALRGYRCVCEAGFEGVDCSWPTNSAPRSGAVKQTGVSRDFSRDFCSSVDCQNGGTCRNDVAGFVCLCPRDYTGKYCTIQRHTETKRYRVTVTLKISYTSDLYYDSTFHDSFRLQIHQLFNDLAGDNKLYIIIDNIRTRGEDVAIEFFMIFTRYIDTMMFTKYDVEQTFERHLAVNRIGRFTATREGFAIDEMQIENEVAALRGSTDVVRDVMLCIMAGVATLCLLVMLAMREWRRYRQNSPRSSLFERLNVRHSTVENNYVVGNGLSRDSGKIPHDEVNDAIHLKEDKIAIDDTDKLQNVNHGEVPQSSWPSKHGANINTHWQRDYLKELTAREQLAVDMKAGKADGLASVNYNM